MEGVVVHWFKYLKKRQLHVTWEGFKDELLKRYSTSWVEEFVQQFEILLAQLEEVMCVGIYKKLELMVNGVSIVADFHLFNLGGVDVILGISWLEILGEVKVNWRTLYMSFEQNGKKMKLQGDPSLCKS
ncbi:hypothetical protein CR513_32869, partial [Mucuna pruriens]